MVILANLIAMVFQALSAKLGIVTGKSLPELCQLHLPKPLVLGMWVVSELAAMATDVAEFIGGALGFALLLNVPLNVGMVITAVLTLGILTLGRNGLRPVELIITALAATIGLCLLAELWIAPVNWAQAFNHIVYPQIADKGAIVLMVGIIGATVMPHAIYLHSGLTKDRALSLSDQERQTMTRLSNREVIIALSMAGFINLAMVVMASAAFQQGHSDVGQIETAYTLLTPLLGTAAAGFFLVSLIASGVASSSVGIIAGDMIMQGFIRRSIPLWVRRLVNMIPAFIIVALGIDSTTALVLSQVMLSLALPVPMLALLYFTNQRRIMGAFVNKLLTRVVAIVGGVLVMVLNGVLLYQTLGG